MKKIKLELENKSIPAKIEFARRIVNSLTGNPNFPSPVPSLDEIKSLTNELEDVYNDVSWRNKLTEKPKMYKLESSLDKILIRLAKYIEKSSKGDRMKIYTAGFLNRTTNFMTIEDFFQYGMKIMKKSIVRQKTIAYPMSIGKVNFY